MLPLCSLLFLHLYVHLLSTDCSLHRARAPRGKFTRHRGKLLRRVSKTLPRSYAAGPGASRRRHRRRGENSRSFERQCLPAIISLTYSFPLSPVILRRIFFFFPCDFVLVIPPLPSQPLTFSSATSSVLESVCLLVCLKRVACLGRAGIAVVAWCGYPPALLESQQAQLTSSMQRDTRRSPLSHVRPSPPTLWARSASSSYNSALD